MKLEDEIKRFNRLQRLATKGTPKYSINEDDVNTREYVLVCTKGRHITGEARTDGTSEK